MTVDTMRADVREAPTTRCAAWIWYRGDRFRGFQAQTCGHTVQQTLAEALERIGANPSVSPAGRTDRGVHARMQVVGLKLPRAIPIEETLERLRALLPPQRLGIVAARASPPSFQAQWSAAGKAYRYRFALGREVPPAWARFAWQVCAHPRLEHRAPSPERLEAALQQAVGTRDFIAFHEKSSTQKRRTLRSVSLHDLGGGVFEAWFDGDGFARYQVRYLAGAAAAVARGVIDADAYAAALDRGTPLGGIKAPGEGLVLWEVHYPPPLDPFTPQERREARGVPLAPPFVGA